MAPVRRENAGRPRSTVKTLLTAGYVDFSLILVVFFLAVFGLIMLFSTSSFEAGLKFGDAAYYLKRQAAATLVGIAVMLFLSFFPDYHVLSNFAVAGYVLSTGLLLLVLSPLGYEANGARRWLQVGTASMHVSVQPAEVAKLAMIVFLATLICAMRGSAAKSRGFFAVLLLPAPVAAMILFITENFSSACIVMGIAVIMLFVATPGYRRFLVMTLIAGILIAGGLYLVFRFVDPEVNVRVARLFAWRDLEAYADGKGYQTLQGLYAIGSGGFFGKGLGESIQKTGFVPEAQNDMIFSIICEELGLFGGIAVILMFLLLLWRLMIIAQNAPDLFGSLLCVGVIAHIAIQVIMNIAVVTNLIPNTGITLPFISFGGSALVMQMAEIGVVMNVARRIKA